MEKRETGLEVAGTPEPEPITIADVFVEKIFETTHLREPQWMKDSKRFSYIDKASDGEVSTIWMYDIHSGERTQVIDAKSLRIATSVGSAPRTVALTDEPEPTSLNIKNYQWSQDEKEILFASAQGHRSFGKGDKAIYAYNLPQRSLRLISEDEQPHLNVKWSPSGKRMGFVKGDDLYITDAEGHNPIRLTDTAQKAVYNGRFGWVYEEELYLTDGWAWSPDEKSIAYFQVDERAVPEVLLNNYDDLHVTPTTTRYPKSGDPNPIIKIGVIRVPDKAGDKVPPTKWIDIGADPDIYIARMQWTPQGDLLLQRIPRLQNRIDLLRADIKTGKTRTILVEEDKAWVDSPGDVKFVEGANQFLWTSERSGFKHVYLYDMEGKLLNQVSSGEWQIDGIVGLDSAHRMVYFTAAHPSPLERHVFSALLDGGGQIVRLTEEHGMHQALFSHDGNHFLNTHSSLDHAPRTRLCRSSGQNIALVHDNPMPKLQNRQPGKWEFTTFKTSDGVSLNAAIMLPKSFDPSKKYPVLMFTYGGPGSQVVQDRFQGGWEQVLSQKGYVLARVDGRGSGGRGRDFMKITYQNLGHWEVNDQIEGAKWLGGMSHIDDKRIGIWGWSYGGYMASYCITKGASVFKAAIAVAPVTHWNFYDSIYTERYMRRPQDNPKGYEASAPLNMTDDLKGKFLLVHGTADDNVHFQNSARLAQEFQKRGKQFRTMFYTGKHHGMEGVGAHLYAMLTDFILENL